MAAQSEAPVDDDEKKAAMEQLSTEDAALVSDFLRYNPNIFSCDVYSSLARLLQLLKRYTLLEIIDSESHLSEARGLLDKVRSFCSEGSWLDSLAHSLSHNSHLDSRSHQELLSQERSLIKRVEFTRGREEWLKAMFQNAETDLHEVREQKQALLEARDKLNAEKISLY